MRLSEAPVFFRASGDNFLRSITRAIVNKNVRKRKVDFLRLFWDFQRLPFFCCASGDNFLRSITRAIVNKNDGKRKIVFFDVVFGLSEALVCFRASGENFLRSFFWSCCVSLEAFRNCRLLSCLRG